MAPQHKLLSLLLISVMAGVSGCGSENASRSSSIETTIGPVLMTISTTEVVAGEVVQLNFNGELLKSHGAYYQIDNLDSEFVAGLWSNKLSEPGVESPGYVLEFSKFSGLDFPVIDRLPDEILIPPSITPGAYRLCTFNSAPEACINIEVVR